MRLNRLSLATLGVMAATAVCQAQQAYPAKPVRIMVGYAPGGSADVQTRLTARFLEQRVKQPVLVENRPGNGGTIAAVYVGQADPDGYTLLSSNGTLFSDIFLKENYVQALKILTPVRQMVDNRLALVVSSKLPFTSFSELLAYAKANPQKKFNFGASAPNATFMMEMLKQRTGIDYVNVTYKGAVAIVPAMMTGELDLNIDALSPYIGAAQSKSVRVLTVFQPKRASMFPDVPTSTEAGLKGMDDAVVALTVWAPVATPKPIVDKLAGELNAVAANTEFQQQADKIPMPLATPNTPEEVRRATEREYVFWKEAARAANYIPQ